MPKVIVIAPNSPHTKRFIHGIIAAECDVILISNRFIVEFTDLEQYIVNFSLKNLSAPHQIYQILNKFQPQLIHIHQANSYAFHAIRAIKKLSYKPRVILTAWGSDVLLLPEANLLFKQMVRYNLVNSDVITCDSLTVAKRISQLLGVVTKPIHVINFGIQVPSKTIGLTVKRNWILSNRLHKNLYRIDQIIQAFSLVYQLRLISQDYQLIIAGHGENTHYLQALVAKLKITNQIIFTGMLPYDELVEYYRLSKIFVSVPESDATASSLLEAMAYANIPVLSNLPANLEWVLDGVNGMICSNIEQLSNKILEAIELTEQVDKYQQLVNFNRSLILQKADFKVNTSKFINLYSN